MPNNKKIIPVCMTCNKRLTPVFQSEYKQVDTLYVNLGKIGISHFGKTKEDMFCSDKCASAFAHVIIDNIAAQENIKAFRKKRLEQLKACYDACVERDFEKDANRYALRFNDYLHSSNIKGFDKLELFQIKDTSN